MDVRKVATLARLSVTDEEVAIYEKQFQSIIEFFGQLSQVDTEGIEPLVTPTDMDQYWREDQVQDWSGSQDVVDRAPERSGHLFKVPPVV